MSNPVHQLPNGLASALALLAEERSRRVVAEVEAATAKAEAASAKALVSHSEALIARLKLEIEKVRRELYGSRSERKARLLEQMEWHWRPSNGSMPCSISNGRSTVLPPSSVWSAAANTACHSPNGFTSFLDDGRICLTNNAAERALRGFALGRKSWLFAGSDRGAERAAFMATLIMSAKLNDIDPQAWLADVLANIVDTPISRLEQLLPWNWTPPKSLRGRAA